MKQKKAYKYRFYPTDTQKQILARTFGSCRYVYNWALRKRTDAYYQDKQRLYYKDLSALLTDLKQQETTRWLSDVSSVPLQQALRHLDKAFLNFFEERGKYPTFKKKRNQQASTYAANAFQWHDQTLTLAKMDEPLEIVTSSREVEMLDTDPRPFLNRSSTGAADHCAWRGRAGRAECVPGHWPGRGIHGA